jgi:hypothetical protein
MADTLRRDLATQLGISERTLQRFLATVQGLMCLRVGRQISFSPDQVRAILKARECRYPTVCAGPIMPEHR